MYPLIKLRLLIGFKNVYPLCCAGYVKFIKGTICYDFYRKDSKYSSGITFFESVCGFDRKYSVCLESKRVKTAFSPFYSKKGYCDPNRTT